MFNESWSMLLEQYQMSLDNYDIIQLLNPKEKVTFDMESFTYVPCFRDCFWYKSDGSSCIDCNAEKNFYSEREAINFRYYEDKLYLVVNSYVLTYEYELIIEKILEIKSVNKIIAKVPQMQGMLTTYFDEISTSTLLDDLTGAKNRRYLFSNLPFLLNKAKYQKKNIGLALFDIDKFKHINDSFGHKVGDDVLKAVTQILSKTLREHENDSVIRLGGDEFLIVFYGITQEVLELKINRLMNDIANLRVNDHLTKKITLSVGTVMSFESISNDIDELMLIADNRLYDSKRKKNCD